MSRLLFVSLFALTLTSACKEDETESGSTGSTNQTVTDTAQAAADTSAADTGVDPATPAAICTPCDTDSDCGAGKCAQDARGRGYCTRRCNYTGDLTCDAGSYCRQLGTTPNDFFCYPLEGVCAADGEDCAPCNRDQDCKDPMKCIEPFAGVKFCARPCPGDKICPKANMACGETTLVQGEWCLPLVAGAPKAQCGALPLGFCESCRTNEECESGFCHESPNIGSLCSTECDSTNNCPSGTDCVQGACVPPIAYGCQGFLSCFGVDCPQGEICFRGFCIDEP
jgi:hypothetical protein